MTPAKIKKVRINAGLTQSEAGALLYVGPRTWRKWELGERPMHSAFWELFLIKIEEMGK